MPSIAALLVAEVTTKGVEVAKAKLEEMGKATDNAAFKMGTALAVGAAVGGAALLALGVKTAMMAGDFESGMTTLETGAGELHKNLGMVGQGLQQIAVDTGTSTADLIKSMFLVESANYRAAAGLTVERIAAEGAKVGHADLTQVTDILTTSLHDYHLAASSAVPVMNSLIVTVKNGKMVMDDLNQSLTKVLPISGAFGIKMSDVEGALATMAAAGDRGALAGTHLAMMFKALESPAHAAEKEMASMGINSVTLAETLKKSLPDALAMIQDAVSKHFTPGSVEYNRAIMAILGGAKSGAAGLELLGGSFKDLQANTKAAAAALAAGGKDIQGWDTIQGDFNLKLERVKSLFEVIGIRIGTLLLPALGKMLDVVTPLVSAFADWALSGHAVDDIVKLIKDHLQISMPIIAAVAVLIGTGLALAFWALASAAWAAAAGVIAATWPVLAVAAAVAGLVALLKYAYDHWTWFHDAVNRAGVALRNLWDYLKTNIGPALSALGTWIHDTVIPALQSMWDWLANKIGPAFSAFGSLIHDRIIPTLQALHDWIQTHVIPVLQSLNSWINDHVIPTLQTFNSWIRDHILAALQGLWNFLNTSVIPVLQTLQDTIKNQLIPPLQHLWNVIQAQILPVLQQLWNQFQTQVLPALQRLWNQIQTQVIPALQQFRDQIKGPLGDALKGFAILLAVPVAIALLALIGGIVGVIYALSGLVNAFLWVQEKAQGLGGVMRGVGQGIANVFTWLQGLASGWGANLVRNFISGLLGQAGNLMSAVGTLAQGVANHFPHSPVKMGPLVDLEKWGGNITEQLSKGMRGNLPAIQTSLNLMLEPIGKLGTSSPVVPIGAAYRYAASTPAAGGQQIVLVMDGMVVARGLMPHIITQWRNNTGVIM